MIGWLDFRLSKPDWLNFGRSVATELTADGELPSLSGSIEFQIRAALLLSGTLPSLEGEIRFAAPNRLFVAGELPGLTGQVFLAQYFLPPRGPALRVRPTWDAAHQATLRQHSQWSKAQRTVNLTKSSWNTGQFCPISVQVTSLHGIQLPITNQNTWNEGASLTIGPHFAYHTGQVIPIQRDSTWNEGHPVVHSIQHDYPFPIITPIHSETSWNEGQRIDEYRITDWQTGEVIRTHRLTTWDEGRFPFPGGRYVHPDPYGQYTIEGRLDFRCFKPGSLSFGATCFGMRGLLIPWQRSYRVINSASMMRRSDSLDIPVSSLSVKIDWDSWCWTLSATVMTKAGAEAIRTPGTEVTVTINGFVWGFVVDSVNQDRGFNQFSASVSGRSLAAGLSEPYAAKRSYQEPLMMTAEQIATQELPLGGSWFLDWEMVDWTVPAKVYQYQNLTPIESILRLAKAAGGKVQAAPNSLLLTISPRWPQKPWAWTAFTPDATLPASYALKEQLDTQPGAEHDLCIVSGGVDNGIVVKVRRAGTPGDLMVSTVTDPLIVDSLPAVQRGIQEIADQWPLKKYQLQLPLQAQPTGAGLLLPGLTFDFDEGLEGWRGLVTGTSITAGFNTIWQTIEVVSV